MLLFVYNLHSTLSKLDTFSNESELIVCKSRINVLLYCIHIYICLGQSNIQLHTSVFLPQKC